MDIFKTLSAVVSLSIVKVQRTRNSGFLSYSSQLHFCRLYFFFQQLEIWEIKRSLPAVPNVKKFYSGDRICSCSCACVWLLPTCSLVLAHSFLLSRAFSQSFTFKALWARSVSVFSVCTIEDIFSCRFWIAVKVLLTHILLNSPQWPQCCVVPGLKTPQRKGVCHLFALVWCSIKLVCQTATP